MELKHGRVHDVCPDCGAEILVAPLGAFMSQLAQSGYAGVGVVTAHKLPLCDAMQDRTDKQWKEIATAAADEAEEKKSKEREQEKAAREARQKQAQRRADATTKTTTNK